MEKKGPCPCYILGWNVNWCGSYENNMEFPQRMENRTTIWCSTFTYGYLSKENEIIILRNLHSHLHCSIIYHCTDREMIQMSIDRWKENVVDTYSVIYPTWTKKEILPLTTNIDEPERHYGKCSVATEGEILHDSIYESYIK